MKRKAAEETEVKRRRGSTEAWKGIYGRDRKFTARVDRAIARGEYTPPEQGS